MKFLRAAVFLALAAIVYVAVTRVHSCKRGWNREIHRFFSRTVQYDVVGVGPSYIYCTLNPVSVYRETGLTSFNLCSPVQTVEMSCGLIKEMLGRTTPQCIVLGATMFVLDEGQWLNKDAYIHYGADEFPFGLNKIEMLRRCRLPSAIETYLLPLMKYHGRWKTLSREDFIADMMEPEPNFINNFQVVANVSPRHFESLLSVTDAVPSPVCPKSLEILREIKQLTEAHGCKLLLLTAPFMEIADVRRKGRYRVLYDFAAELGVEVLDLNETADDFGLDVPDDFQDYGIHLNVFGSEKTSRYLGRFFVNELGLKPRELEESEKSEWIALEARYEKQKRLAVERARKPQKR